MSDLEYMKMALQLAKSAKGQTSPNPIVGAVVVNNGHVVGFGAHLKAGEPHAEVHAINMAGDKAKGATVYVTLEPCSHFGKTPPCSNLLIDKEVARVVVATTDPNPKVAGKGLERLEKAGIKVEVGLLKEEADQCNEVFFHFLKTRQPFVTLKSATSLDGKTATVTGDSKWISSKESREDVHRYRHEHDAILVGINTILKDNPSLTTRLPNGGKNPIRVILDTNLRIPSDSVIINDGKAETWVITGKNVSQAALDNLSSKSVRIVKMDNEFIHIQDLLNFLGENEVTSLFVEGGAEVNASFVKSGLVNQVITYIAPKLIGGSDAPTSIGGEGIRKIEDVISLEIKSVEKIGADVKIVSVPKEGN